MSASALIVAVLAVSLALVVAQPGIVDCDEPRFDLLAYGSGVTAPGEDLGAVSTVYQQYSYSLTLSAPVTTFDAVVNITLEGATLGFANTSVNFIQVLLNGFVQKDSSGNPITFTSTGHTSVLAQIGYPSLAAAPTGTTFANLFQGAGARAATNVVVVNITQYYFSGAAFASGYELCNFLYTFTIVNPASPGGGGLVQGDPQFRGLRGQSYQIHGIDGAVYNLISDADFQMNSRFTFLNGPRPCPQMPSGAKSAACWSHPGSYLSQIGVMSGGHELYIEAGPSRGGLAQVTFDGRSMAVNSTNAIATRTSTHEITVHAGDWTIEIENSDMFLNLRTIKVSSTSMSQLRSHGLIGQTWKRATYSTSLKYIEGDVDDYLILDDSVFGTNFVYNKYQQ